jgi:hypothetical protein
MIYSVPDRMSGRTSAAGDGAAGDLSRRDGQLQTRSSTSPFAMRADTGEYGRNGDWRMETASISDAGCEGLGQRSHNWIKSVVGGKLRQAWGEGSSAQDGASRAALNKRLGGRAGSRGRRGWRCGRGLAGSGRVTGRACHAK